MSDDEDYKARDERAKQELQQIMLEMDAVTDKSLASTRNMVSLTHEASTTGAATLSTLNEQGEAITRVETRLDEAHEELHAAAKNLDELEKCCGCCILPWNLGSKRKQHANVKRYDDINAKDEKRREKEAKKEAKKQAKAEKHRGSNEVSPPAEPVEEDYIQRITNDDREDEMNRNLNEVHNMVLGLKAMGTDMHNEVDKQNKALDRIGEKAVTLDDQVHLADKRAKKIVRKM